MFQTITKGLLHFEDLEPKLFEYLYRNILVTSDDYEPDIKSYGIKEYDFQQIKEKLSSQSEGLYD